MKELSTALGYAEYTQRRGCGTVGDFNLTDLLQAVVNNDCSDSSGVGLLGNSIRSTFGWAKAEALNPSRIRLFFTEDFLLQPEVAMRGLAKFLQVPDFSTATEKVIEQAGLLANMAGNRQNLTSQAEQPLDVMRSMMNASTENLVVDFEQQLAQAPESIQLGWAHLVETW